MASKNDELIKRYRQLVDDVKASSEVNKFEAKKDQEKRIQRLLSNDRLFAEYYFPKYCFAPSADFQVRACRDALNMPNTVHLWQWYREAAKSVYSNIILPAKLNCIGELSGMIIGCANEDDAIAKLQDLQVFFEVNERFRFDFGDQKLLGSWEDGNFAIKSGAFFRGFGKNQSPRGVRFMHNRPNFGVIDDLDTKQTVKNERISKEHYNWVKEDFMGALATKKWRLIVPENKFSNNTVTAQFENDKEVKVHLVRVNMLNAKGESSWPENCSTEIYKQKISAVGFISAQREYFNNPIEEGTIFKDEWFRFEKMLPYHEYDHLITYTDPSYKNTDKSDYKATALIGKKGLEYHVIKVFVDKVSLTDMFGWMYSLDTMTGENVVVYHYMEANFLQDLLLAELNTLAKTKGFMLPVRKDSRSKPDKFQRIEALQPTIQNGYVKFNIDEADDPGMIRLKNQFLAFEKGSRVNDDGPDCIEGGITTLNSLTITTEAIVIGKRGRNNKRY